MGAWTLGHKHKLRKFHGLSPSIHILKAGRLAGGCSPTFHSKMNLSYSSVVGFLLLTKLLQTFQNLETCFINSTNVRTPFVPAGTRQRLEFIGKPWLVALDTPPSYSEIKSPTSIGFGIAHWSLSPDLHPSIIHCHCWMRIVTNDDCTSHRSILRNLSP